MSAPIWFADTDPEHPGWQPVLQAPPMCLPLPVWFATKKECEDFISAEILPAKLNSD